MSFKWIDSTGYPMILLSERNVSLWNGINGDAEKAEKVLPNQDIDIGIFEHNDEQVPAFSLWEDPRTFSTIQYLYDELYIIRFHCGHSFEDVPIFLSRTTLEGMEDWQNDGEITLNGGLYYYLEAGIDGREDFDLYEDDVLSISILKGNYAIRSRRYSPNKNYILILHHLQKKD